MITCTRLIEQDGKQVHWCSRCERWKRTDLFYGDVQQSCGLRRVCAKCECKNKKNARTNNPQKFRDITWERVLRTCYGIDRALYSLLSHAQGEVCALCLKPSQNGKRLAVDHEHAHHENVKQACRECIRGLLCDGCNRFALPILEGNAILQNDRVHEYLKQRPLSTKRTEQEPAQAIEDAQTV
jgi:hypothetical protein